MTEKLNELENKMNNDTNEIRRLWTAAYAEVCNLEQRLAEAVCIKNALWEALAKSIEESKHEAS